MRHIFIYEWDTYEWDTFLHMNEARLTIWIRSINRRIWMRHTNGARLIWMRHIWMRHLSTYECINRRIWMRHTNEARLIWMRHIWMRHVPTYEWDTYEWDIRMRRVLYEWGIQIIHICKARLYIWTRPINRLVWMRHMNEARLIWMRRISNERGASHMNEAHIKWTRHISYE